MSLRVYKSNYLEHLVEHLAGRVLKQPLSSPLVRERIVVETQGMAQWLKLELARRQGIVANVEFPFPRAFISELIRAVVPPELQTGAIEPEALTWRVFAKLPELLEDPAFVGIRNYLSGSDDPRRAFQLAERAASLLDQYSVYRPKLIEDWIQGKGSDDWQAVLWRTVMTNGLACQGKFLFELIQGLQKTTFNAWMLPERLSVFGPGSLPPMYLKVFEALAQHIPVHLFYFCPCREYFGDDPSAWEADRIQQKVGQGNLGAEELHLGAGNPLLASCGRTGRGFQQLITDLQADELELFKEPGKTTLLAQVQSSILTLDENREVAEIAPVKETDRSLQVHSCHSPLRELQVLRDQMLDWFAADPNLSPQDVLVMLTDLEEYAPFIKGVFDDAEPGAPAIPFTLADRGARLESSLVDGFVSFLQLATGRLAVTAILDFFETAAVRRRFGVTEDELEQIRLWIQEATIRWGRNADHRASFGLPAFPEHSWAHGCDRLLLGYAMADTREALVHDLLPCEGIEGTCTNLLGRWLDFLDALFLALDQLSKPQTLQGWAATLNHLLDSLFLPDTSEERAANAIRIELDKLRQQQRVSSFNQEVPLAVVLERLVPKLQEPQPGKAFLRGAVTFCGLNPMRGIPFKVICLLGMQDGSFPRNPAPPSFDHMAANPQVGDESRRDDDRYLFLESLLAARERFYLSYVGQSVRDNSPRPPSVVLSELLDYVGARYRLEGAVEDSPGKVPAIIKGLLVATHRLHVFSPAYFVLGEARDARLFSYSPAAARVSQALVEPEKRQTVEPFVTAPLVVTLDQPKIITLRDLQWFFKNPSRVFVEKRLEFRLPEETEQLLDEEPFSLDGLATYYCKQDVLDGYFAKRERESLVSQWRGAGRLPPGPSGASIAAGIFAAANPVLERVKAKLNGGVVEELAFEVAVGGYTIKAQLKHAPGLGLVRYRAAKVEQKKAEPHVRLWLEHLIYQLSEFGKGKRSWLIGEDETWVFEPVTDPAQSMLSLLALYERGFSKPLPFFSRTSFAFAIGPGPKTKKTAEELALEVWEGDEDSDYKRGEKEDPYLHLCFRNDPNPLGDEFQAIAREVVDPILACEKEETV